MARSKRSSGRNSKRSSRRRRSMRRRKQYGGNSNINPITYELLVTFLSPFNFFLLQKIM